MPYDGLSIEKVLRGESIVVVKAKKQRRNMRDEG